MNKISLFPILLLFLFACKGQPEPPSYEISGSIPGNAEKVYLKLFNNEDKSFYVVDSSVVNQGQFRFTGSLTAPDLYRIAVPEGQYVELFLDNSKVSVHFDTAERGNSSVKGSVSDSLYKVYMKSYADNTSDILGEIKRNPKSFSLAYCLYRYNTYNKSAEELADAVNLFDTSVVRHSPYIAHLDLLIKTYRRVQPGQPTMEIKLPDPDGNERKLSEHLGNYVLLDFWASWCGPCRAENPNLVKLYKKFHPKGFEIYAVSLDKSKDAWTKAIKDDQLGWVHVSDLKYWACKPADAYGVRAIPSNFLIDPKGKIVARNVMGEALEKMLEEIYNAKKR